MAKAKTAFEITIAVPQTLIDNIAAEAIEAIVGDLENDILKTLKIKPAALLKNLKADPQFQAAAEKEIRKQISEGFYSPEESVDTYEAADNILDMLGAKHELQQLNVSIASAQQQLAEAEKKAKFDREVDTLISALQSRGYTVSKK